MQAERIASICTASPAAEQAKTKRMEREVNTLIGCNIKWFLMYILIHTGENGGMSGYTKKTNTDKDIK